MTGYLPYDIVMCVLVFIIGSVIGSFLNVVIYRTPQHMSIISGPSHCTTCNERIKPYDLVPIFSWILLGGRCRKCKSRISARYTVVEALTGLMFLLAYIRFSVSVPMVIAIAYFALLIVLSCIDLDTMEIPYWCTISIAILGIPTFFTEPNMPWWEHLAGAAAIAVPFAIFAFFGAMGGGDVQLMAASGFMLGFKIVPGAFIGIVLGGIYGCISMLLHGKADKAKGAEVSAAFAEWLDGKMRENSSDVVVGEFENGEFKINWDIFDEKAWLSPDIRKGDTELDTRLTEVMGECKTEYAFHVKCENGTVKKAALRRRIAFGPALSVGLAVAVLYGELINKWYFGLH